jgi:hypothetical protein
LVRRQFVLAVVIAVPALNGQSLAQGGSGICTVANTCSEAFFQCITVNCPRIANAGCTGACRARFDTCMATGGFGGPECRDKTLIRK